MKNILLVCLVILFFGTAVPAQTKPFEKFDNAVKEGNGGFAGDKEKLSAVFNEERIRLGENFESELWKYLGDDLEKHYWIGFFLKEPSYLHDNTPLPELAFKIWTTGLETAKHDGGEGNRFKLLIVTSVLAQTLGKTEAALTYKNESAQITASDTNVSAYFPVLDSFERCLFEHIGGDTTGCKKDSILSDSKEIIVSKGMINGSATELPKPQLTEEVVKKRIRGKVEVQIVINEKGNVISAKALSGPEELQKIAVKAARGAKFTPTILAGKAVKVSGIVVYNFN
jgi:TonB family protein